MEIEFLPALMPDIRFDRLFDTEEAINLSFAAKKAALGPHIRARWDWNEAYQLSVHRDRFSEKPFFAILRNVDVLGTLSWMVLPDHIRFGEFYLFVQHQNKGLGTRILRHMLVQANAAQLPMRLEYLKWNPVGALYLRHGFRVTHETDIHYFLERVPD